MNAHPIIEQSLDLLKTYQWGKLWKGVRTVTLQTPTSDNFPLKVKQQLLAIKAMLLSSWWQSPHLIDEILTFLDSAQTDPLVHFSCRYALLAKGDLPALKALEKRQPTKMPLWMREWLKLEYLGRSLQSQKQIQLIRSLIQKHNQLPDWAAVALLQSLDHHQADIQPLKTLINDQAWLHATQTHPLILALGVRIQSLSVYDAMAHMANIDPNRLQTTDALCQSDLLDTLKPNLFNIIGYRLANRLFVDKRLNEALYVMDALAPSRFIDMTSIQKWLVLSTSLPQGLAGLDKRVAFAMQCAPDDLISQGTLASYGLIGTWLKGEIKQSYEWVKTYHAYQDLPTTEINKNAQIFFRYVLSLCVAWQHNGNLFEHDPLVAQHQGYAPLWVLGESHSLTLSHLKLQFHQQRLIGQVGFIMGVKMYHLAQTDKSYHDVLFQTQLNQVPDHAHFLLTIGEIDTRPDEGIWKNSYHKQKPYEPVVDATVTGYINYLKQTLKDKTFASITIQGIPAPNYPFKDAKDPIDTPQFLAMIRYTNAQLKHHTLNAGFQFLDVYAATLDETTGKSHGQHHIDGYHLSPVFYQHASDWLVKPA